MFNTNLFQDISNPPSFTPWIYGQVFETRRMELLRDVRDVNSEMRNAELRNERHRSKIIPYMTIPFHGILKAHHFSNLHSIISWELVHFSLNLAAGQAHSPGVQLWLRVLMPTPPFNRSNNMLDRQGGFAPHSVNKKLLRDPNIFLQQTLFMLLDRKEMQRTL